MDASENQLYTQIAEQYYVTCEAAEQSGKTAWLGIEPDMTVMPQRWKVRLLLLYYLRDTLRLTLSTFSIQLFFIFLGYEVVGIHFLL